MSNAKSETIVDIVREMRTLGMLDEKSTDKIPRSLQALGLRTYADRIEAAARREREAGAAAAQICGEVGEMVGREAARMSEKKDWLKICADCREGYPPKYCEYYGEPRGCNAPTYGGPPPNYYVELKRENELLRAALKPVLECPSERPCFVMPDCPRSLAMKEAWRTYNECEAKEQ